MKHFINQTTYRKKKMVKASRDFQVFVKPVGALCNLDCVYCYYLEKEHIYPLGESFQMPYDVLEKYITQHIEASPEQIIRFSWHGGEPTLLGLEYFRKITSLQHKHKPPNKTITNGIQTNGTLLDDDWGLFFAQEGFAVGISIDGPKEMHDKYRFTKDHKPTHEQTIRGYKILQKHGVATDILCVINSHNVRYPLLVYRFFKQINAQYITFLPLVEREVNGEVNPISVSPEEWGVFLCTVFDEWISRDIGKIKVQIFEEAARTAFNQEHSLCIFRPTCGNVPVIEHNGDFFSCDHFVDDEHHLGNIKDVHLVELLESPEQRSFGRAKLEKLPRICRECDVRDMCNGGCPKNRFIMTPDGEQGLNYLCLGYKQFFRHCKPFVSEVASLWRQQKSDKKNKV
jgi:uncharacterized protein